MSLRRARCSRPSSSSTDRSPTTGASDSVRPGGSPCSREVYSAWIASGSEIITIGLSKPTNLTLNASPKRRRHEARNAIGRTSQRSVWTAGGSAGPVGSAVVTPSRVSEADPWVACEGARARFGRDDDVVAGLDRPARVELRAAEAVDDDRVGDARAGDRHLPAVRLGAVAAHAAHRRRVVRARRRVVVGLAFLGGEA